MTSSTASEPIAAPDTSAEPLFPLHLPEDVAESGPVLRLTTLHNVHPQYLQRRWRCHRGLQSLIQDRHHVTTQRIVALTFQLLD